MYAVVGCNECGNLWLLADPDESESAQCPRCGKRHQTRKLKRWFSSENREEARQARARLLAARQGAEAALSSLDSVAEMEDQLDDAGVSDEEYLEASGLDADAVAEAGDASKPPSKNRVQIVKDAVREQEQPLEEEVLAYAYERGVSVAAARDVLEKLVREGEVSESRGLYRLL